MSETPPESQSGPAPEPPPEPEPEPVPPPAPEPAEAPRPVLRRSRDDRVIAGVCGGLGRHFGIDPVVLRLVFVVLLLAGGSGILLYVVGWIAIPEERPGDELGAAREGERRGGGAEVIGITLVVLGAFFLLREAFPDAFDSDYVWPVLLIVIGLVVLARGVRR
jgi:phage shock protein PspC (stress-responsive transcriptional regulator)